MTLSLKTIGLAAAITALTAGSAMAAVSTTSLNVRSGPGTGYGVIDTLSPGEEVSIQSESNGWCQIRWPGPTGWASCAYLTGGTPTVATGPDYSLDYGPDYDYGPPVYFGPTFPVFPTHHFYHMHHSGNDWWWMHNHHP